MHVASNIEDWVDRRGFYRGAREVEVSPLCPRTRSYMVRVYDAAFGCWAAGVYEAELLERNPDVFPLVVIKLDLLLDEETKG